MGLCPSPSCPPLPLTSYNLQVNLQEYIEWVLKKLRSFGGHQVTVIVHVSETEKMRYSGGRPRSESRLFFRR